MDDERSNVLSDDALVIDETEEYFGPLYPFVKDDSITDIDFNGNSIWLTDSANTRFESSVKLSPAFVEAFTKRIANSVSKPFHKQQPILEAETDTLRITIVHESVALTGRSICIRKSLPYVRMTEESMVAEGYCTKEILNLLKNCIFAKRNIVFCGEPGAGKTECAKFLSQFIRKEERVVTIEETPEIHYRSINPRGDCIELKVGSQMDYSTAIKTCLRMNPKWMMLSESRSTEVLRLIEGFSTGVKGITTLHTDDVRSVPDRMVNMSGQIRNEGRVENDVYNFVDLAVLIKRREEVGEDGSRKVCRYIDQIASFERSGHENICHMIVDGGKLLPQGVPEHLAGKLFAAGIFNPLGVKDELEEKIESDPKRNLALRIERKPATWRSYQMS